MSTSVKLTDENKVFDDCELFGFKKGDDFVRFYNNNRNNLQFEKTEYYNMTHYLEEEKLDEMIKKNKCIERLMETFDLTI